MGVRATVFASTAERRNYYKLSRQWGEVYRVHHNLPFLAVFDTETLVDVDSARLTGLSLDPLDEQRLKKTSVDYTLCDAEDRPLVCIDFDGLNDGYNVGRRYRPERGADPWRTRITQLKLRVAHGSLFPYFVVGSRHFVEFSPEVRLTVVDGIIGEVMSGRAARERFAAGFDPSEVGFTQEEFDALDPGQQNEVIQDWVFGVEIEADLTHNPVVRRTAELDQLAGHPRHSLRFLESPPIPDGLPMLERVRRLAAANLNGASCTLSPPDRPSIERTVWLPNFQTPGFSSGLRLLEEMAHLLALSALLKSATL